MKIGKFVVNILCTLSIIFYAALGVCYGEILIKHDSPNPEYRDKNIIVNFVRSMEENSK